MLMPNDVEALCSLALAYWECANVHGAWEMAQRALQTDSECGPAHSLCGLAHDSRGEQDKARAAFAKAGTADAWPG